MVGVVIIESVFCLRLGLDLEKCSDLGLSHSTLKHRLVGNENINIKG